MMPPFRLLISPPPRHQQHQGRVFGVVQGRSVEEPANSSIHHLQVIHFPLFTSHVMVLAGVQVQVCSNFSARCRDVATLKDADLGIWPNYIEYCLSDRRGTSTTYDQSLSLFLFLFQLGLGNKMLPSNGCLELCTSFHEKLIELLPSFEQSRRIQPRP